MYNSKIKKIEDFKQVLGHNGISLEAPFGMISYTRATQTLNNEMLSSGFILLSTEGYEQLIVNPEFNPFFDPNSKLEDVKGKGFVGSMFGCSIFTDAFLTEEERFVRGIGKLYPPSVHTIGN